MKDIDWSEENYPEIAAHLRSGQLAVIPTDTLYGVLALANSKESVEMVYKIKGRKPDKPFIILISKVEDLKIFEVYPTPFQEKFLERVWPGTVSVVLSCVSEKFSYLHRGTETLAFRLPKDKDLRYLLEVSGPLIAPSTNPEGMSPALDIETAKKYFGEKVDIYVDAGRREAPPSTLVSLVNNKPVVLRGELKDF